MSTHRQTHTAPQGTNVSFHKLLSEFFSVLMFHLVQTVRGGMRYSNIVFIHVILFSQNPHAGLKQTFHTEQAKGVQQLVSGGFSLYVYLCT